MNTKLYTLLAAATLALKAQRACWCHTCDPATVRFVVCPDCGNKRCPKATHHAHACTNSNDPGQPGSLWENTPKVREQAGGAGSAAIEDMETGGGPLL